MAEQELILEDAVDLPVKRLSAEPPAEARQRIGQILIESFGLRPDQLAEGLDRQELLAGKHRYYLLGRILVGLGYVNIDQVREAALQQQAAGASIDLDRNRARAANRRAPSASQSWQVTTQTGPVRPFSALRTLANIDDKVAAGDLETTQPVGLGFDPLDEALSGGIRPGELLLIGGGQGVGKTTFAFQMARNIAVSGEANCLYVCYEHDEENLVQRLVAMETVDASRQDFRVGATVRELNQQISASRGRMADGLYAVLEADPRTRMALQRLRGYGDRLFLLKGAARTSFSAINALVEAHRVRSDDRLVLFVDYLQKVPLLPDSPSEQERVTRVVEGLKELAMSHQIPVVAVVAADLEGLKSKRMRAHHLWGGSALAYEADIILMLAEKYDTVARVHIEFNPQKAEVFRDWVICTVEKNRIGRSAVDVEFEKHFSYACFSPNGRFVVEKLVDARVYTE